MDRFDTPQAAGAIVIGAVLLLAFMRRAFASVTVSVGG